MISFNDNETNKILGVFDDKQIIERKKKVHPLPIGKREF